MARLEVRQRKRTESKLMGLVLALGLVASLVSMPGCLAAEVLDCRQVQTEELTLECEDNDTPFTGELHFDSAATYETFLAQQCIPSETDNTISAYVSQIDFTNDAAFVAVGPNAIDSSRCVETRELDSVEVCNSGLKVYFDDTYQSSSQPGSDLFCPSGRWTVAFSLSRDDLRAALEAGDSDPFFD
jgi:hypothetical protein